MHSFAAVFVFTSLLSQAPTHSHVAPPQVVEPHQSITVAVGETLALSFKNVRNYSLNPMRMVDIRISPDGKSGLLTGRVAGTATLRIIFQDGSPLTYDITVK